MENLEALKEALGQNSGDGFCEKVVNDMKEVSNEAFCEGGVKENVGYYFRTTFAVENSGTRYEFRTPVDFSLGGVVVFDTEVMELGSGSFDVVLDEGNHVLELYGASATDTTTSWQFAVNNSDWLEYTTDNFNK